MNTDLYIDPTTHDLVVVDGTARLTADTEEDAAQRLKIRLLIFQEEWLLDLREGVPYYQSILEKNDKQVVDAIFKAKIAEEPLVENITSFESTLNTGTRGYSLEFTVKLVNGEETSSSFTIGV